MYINSVLVILFVVLCYGNPTLSAEISEVSSELPASQTSSYKADNINDSSWRSWAEGVPGNGIGEYFTFKLHRRNDGANVIGFALKNGYGNLDYYTKNNRVKSFKIYVDGQYTETIPVKDSTSFEQYTFSEPIAINKSIRFVIDDVYSGTMYDDTCVAEIVLLKEISSRQDFYENILFWIGEFRMMMYSSNDWNRLVSVADNDKIMLLHYMPFDIPDEFGNIGLSYADYQNGKRLKTEVALLDEQASLQLHDNLPRIDGATAMYPLYSAFVRAVYPEIEIPVNENGDKVLVSWAYFPNNSLAREISYNSWYSPHGDFQSIVQCNTTPEAYQRLIDGEADIIFCYEPSEAERNAAAEKGKTFQLTPVAKDAFVFIVNEKNVLTNITQQQIRDIYSGRITNWKSMSGVDEPIIAYQRPENSGSQTILQSIMKGESTMLPILDGEWVSQGMAGHYRAVASDFYNYNSAIGYSFLFYLNEMVGGAGIKTLSIDGIVPSPQNIQSGLYPYAQTVYAVTTGNEGENTQKLIDWILSEQGQELVEKTGYVPIR